MEFYQEELLDHYRSPRNEGVVDNPDALSLAVNPSCGDSISLSLCIKNNHVADIKFQGKGCVISQAAASLLTQKIKHQALTTILDMTPNDMLELIKISLGPTRLRCALLSLEAAHKAVNSFTQRTNNVQQPKSF